MRDCFFAEGGRDGDGQVACWKANYCLFGRCSLPKVACGAKFVLILSAFLTTAAPCEAGTLPW